uniref:Uncharacterized protein n=1 Tax=Anguilla anguilla TaxID=7936 RepID=A0A0E9W6R1_ANGAN
MALLLRGFTLMMHVMNSLSRFLTEESGSQRVTELGPFHCGDVSEPFLVLSDCLGTANCKGVLIEDTVLGSKAAFIVFGIVFPSINFIPNMYFSHCLVYTLLKSTVDGGSLLL